MRGAPPPQKKKKKIMTAENFATKNELRVKHLGLTKKHTNTYKKTQNK